MSFPVTFIFITFAMCSMCTSGEEIKTAIEGDEVQLEFSYPCISTSITLQYRNRVPFYTLAQTESISLLPVQMHRFTFRNTSEDDHCSLHVRINPVNRADAGTCMLYPYGDDGTTTGNIKKIELHVGFPPGKASCTMGVENITGNWVALDCEAPVGSLSGQIDCYQNGERMPPQTPPTETYNHLKQIILVKRKHTVFCCTSTLEHTKDLCNCNDFQWDLANDKILRSVIDPCGPTIPMQDLTQTSEIASNATSVSTDGTILKINYSNVSVIWKYAVSILSSILIIGLVVPVILFMLRYKQKTRRKAAKTRTRKLTKSRNQTLNKLYEPYTNPRKNQCMLLRPISV